MVNGVPQTWNGKRVVLDDKRMPCYEVPSPTKANPNNVRLERIWILEPPSTAPNPDLEAPPETYEGELGNELKHIYDVVRETGEFPGGLMPEIPPKREWLGWNV